MSNGRGIDVRWAFATAVALGFLSASVLSSVAYEVTTIAGLLIVMSGVVLALDYRHAVDRWLTTIRISPNVKMDPRNWTKLMGVFMAPIGLVWFLGSVSMLVLGRSPQ